MQSVRLGQWGCGYSPIQSPGHFLGHIPGHVPYGAYRTFPPDIPTSLHIYTYTSLCIHITYVHMTNIHTHIVTSALKYIRGPTYMHSNVCYVLYTFIHTYLMQLYKDGLDGA